MAQSGLKVAYSVPEGPWRIAVAVGPWKIAVAVGPLLLAFEVVRVARRIAVV